MTKLDNNEKRSQPFNKKDLSDCFGTKMKLTVQTSEIASEGSMS